jgi:hypothetical protein
MAATKTKQELQPRGSCLFTIRIADIKCRQRPEKDRRSGSEVSELFGGADNSLTNQVIPSMSPSLIESTGSNFSTLLVLDRTDKNLLHRQ